MVAKSRKANKPGKQRLAGRVQRKAKQRTVANRRRTRRGRGNAPGGALASYATSSAATPRDSARLCGVDRIGEPIDQSKLTKGAVVFDLLVEPTIARRMADLALAFQRVRYVKLRFRVTSHFPSIASGGYLAGFIKDPADKLPALAASYLISNTGAKVTNWWISTNYDCSLGATRYYTDRPTQDSTGEVAPDTVRSYSPGRFVVVCDSIPNQTGSISLELEWEVVFSDATLKEYVPVPATLTFGDNLPETNLVAIKYVPPASQSDPECVTIGYWSPTEQKYARLPADLYPIPVNSVIQLRRVVNVNVVTVGNVDAVIPATHITFLGGDFWVLSAYNSYVDKIAAIMPSKWHAGPALDKIKETTVMEGSLVAKTDEILPLVTATGRVITRDALAMFLEWDMEIGVGERMVEPFPGPENFQSEPMCI